MSLTYDDRGFLMYAQVHRHKYYVATDHCGTPVMIFNQYGEGIREMMRSPYGHIVYDSNPYLYLPIDFCGGLLDQVRVNAERRFERRRPDVVINSASRN